MAGHSKWKNIKHKKAAADAKKAKKFTKLLKEITVAARSSGGDLAANPHLRTLIQKANEINMPKENYQRAIKRGTGEIAGNAYESFFYEGYGCCGIAVIVEVLSDNKNRAAAELRAAFGHNGGVLGETGSVGWMFDKVGIINLEKNILSEDQLLESLLDFPISDISIEENSATVICDISALNSVKMHLEYMKLCIDEAIVGYHPKTFITLTDEEMDKASNFLTILEDLEDVQNVFSNI
jgi:YebC/PmpR family DNA-binding regulatory protein